MSDIAVIGPLAWRPNRLELGEVMIAHWVRHLVDAFIIIVGVVSFAALIDTLKAKR